MSLAVVIPLLQSCVNWKTMLCVLSLRRRISKRMKKCRIPFTIDEKLIGGFEETVTQVEKSKGNSKTKRIFDVLKQCLSENNNVFGSFTLEFPRKLEIFPNQQTKTLKKTQIIIKNAQKGNPNAPRVSLEYGACFEAQDRSRQTPQTQKLS